MSSRKKQTSPPVAERKRVEIRCQFAELVPISALKPHPKNPREHGKKQVAALAAAIERNGFRRPVVASRLSGTIIAGHGTVAAAKALGMDSVPVDWQDFADAAAEAAFLVSDNHIARMGTTDSRMVAEILDEHGGMLDLESFGFTAAERLVFLGGHEKDDSQVGKPARKTTKNGAQVAESDPDEQPDLIVANISKAAGRKLAAWKKSHEIDDDDTALDSILKSLKP